MRRRVVAPPAPPGGVPLELRAGRCLELWSPDRLDFYEARRGWGDARDWWLQAAGIGRDCHRWPRVLFRAFPWSYTKYALAGGLAEELEIRGLPAGWRPADSVPATRAWLARGRP